MSQDTLDTIKQAVKTEIPSTLLELYIVDATVLGAGIFRFCNYADNGEDVVFQGLTYTRYPIKADGFTFTVQGQIPRPTITFSNLFGAFTALNVNFQDLVGARLVRKRVFAQNIDSGTNPNPNTGWTDDVYYFHQKTTQNKSIVTYELSSPLELESVMLPGRQVQAAICSVRYRSAECGYTGPPVADFQGNPPPGVVTTPNQGVWSPTSVYQQGDVVFTRLQKGRKLFCVCLNNNTSGINTEPPNTAYWFVDDCSLCLKSGCEMRFGKGVLPFAAFPGTSQAPQGT